MMLTESIQRTDTACPACNRPHLEVFFRMEQMPVFCNVLCDTPQQAKDFPRADIHLGWCNQCDLIYNVAFDASRLDYDAAYENSLHFSPHFQQFAESLAGELVERYALRDKDIIEVGCGQGDFLRLLAQKGGNRAFGFDPSYRGEEGQAPEEITIIPEAYNERFTEQPADLICSRHVLEHIERPQEFLNSLRRTLGDRTETPIYIEVPDALYTLKDMGIWDIIYEHCSYYTPRALGLLFARCGFKPLYVTERYNNQFLSIEALPAERAVADDDPAIPPETAQTYVQAFGREYAGKKQKWQANLQSWKRDDRRVVLWGAGSKGVTFLNAMQIDTQQLPYIVDVNPRKQGRFVVGMAQEIISPEKLREVQPQVVVIMNAVYEQEIKGTLNELGCGAEVVTA